jgi:hypothetical protein
MDEAGGSGQEEHHGDGVAHVGGGLGAVTEDAEPVAGEQGAAQRPASEQALDLGVQGLPYWAVLIGQGSEIVARLGVGLAIVDLAPVHGDVVVGVALRLLAGDERLGGVNGSPRADSRLTW